MKSKLIYVELKTYHSDNGPAWIGDPSYSKSRATIYFNGLALKSLRGSGIEGNYYESFTGDEYWVSGIKMNGQDRHWAGRDEVLIDKFVVTEYLSMTNQKTLPKNIVSVTLKPSKPSVEHHNLENKSLDEEQEPVLGRRPITKKINRLVE